MKKVENYLIKGTVKFAGNDNGMNSLTLIIRQEYAEKLIDIMKLDPEKYEGIPLKEDEDGTVYFKSKSKFAVQIYEKGSRIDNDQRNPFTLDDIGEGSEVELFVGIGESVFQRKTFQVAHLKKVNIIKLSEQSRFNPFTEDSNLTVIE